jgi:signal peptidase II
VRYLRVLDLRVVLLLLILTAVGCDRVTKHMATTTLAGTPVRSYLGDTVRLAYVENRGGFLSLGAELPHPVRTAVFTGATGIVLFGLAAVAIRNRWAGWRAFGVTLFIAGGLSNWIDRVLHGRVVDFMNVGVGPLRTGIFNAADVAIMLGVAIFLFAEFRRRDDDRPPIPRHLDGSPQM